MKIHSSHLALRFYVKDGWTKEIVEKYLISGNVEHCFPGDKLSYFRPSIDAVMDCKAMIGDKHEVIRFSPGAQQYLTDLQYLESF